MRASRCCVCLIYAGTLIYAAEHGAGRGEGLRCRLAAFAPPTPLLPGRCARAPLRCTRTGAKMHAGACCGCGCAWSLLREAACGGSLDLPCRHLTVREGKHGGVHHQLRQRRAAERRRRCACVRRPAAKAAAAACSRRHYCRKTQCSVTTTWVCVFVLTCGFPGQRKCAAALCLHRQRALCCLL